MGAGDGGTDEAAVGVRHSSVTVPPVVETTATVTSPEAEGVAVRTTPGTTAARLPAATAGNETSTLSVSSPAVSSNPTRATVASGGQVLLTSVPAPVPGGGVHATVTAARSTLTSPDCARGAQVPSGTATSCAVLLAPAATDTVTASTASAPGRATVTVADDALRTVTVTVPVGSAPAHPETASAVKVGSVSTASPADGESSSGGSGVAGAVVRLSTSAVDGASASSPSVEPAAEDTGAVGPGPVEVDVPGTEVAGTDGAVLPVSWASAGAADVSTDSSRTAHTAAQRPTMDERRGVGIGSSLTVTAARPR